MEIYTYKHISRRARRQRRWKALCVAVIISALLGALGGLLWVYTHPLVITYEAPKQKPVVLKPEKKSIAKKQYSREQIDAWQEQKKAEARIELEKQLAPEEVKIALAIVQHESHFVAAAQNWNCYYSDDGTVYESRVKGASSKSCLKGHRKYAWSVDCGVAQINFKGKECPAYSMETQWSLERLVQMYHDRGDWTAWVAYTSGAYRKYL